MKIKIFFLVLSIVLLGACANEDYENITNVDKNDIIKTYSSDLLLATEGGGTTDISTRGLDPDDGVFTDVYPYDYIYIHSADDKREGHKSLRIPLTDVVFCDGCQGIHLEMDVLDESEGGGYIIKNEAGDEIRLAEGEKVYFSTIESSYWNAEVKGASPVTSSSVFIQDNDVNKELLKSAQEYTEDDLINLLSQGEPDIPMMRHCTAFRVYFMFTELDETGGYLNTNNYNQWNKYIGGEEYSPEHFYIKLYLGPNFTEEYNVFKNDVTNPEEWGFYTTNQQTYQPFEISSYNTESGTSGGVSYRGWGYLTDYSNFLITPLNEHELDEKFSVYAFIKYAPDPNNLPEDFLTSDKGAKWFKLEVPDMLLTANRVHYIIMMVDLNSLNVFKTPTNGTRAFNGPEEMEVKSAVVKDVVE